MAASWSSAWEHFSPAQSGPSAPAEMEFLGQPFNKRLESFAPCYSLSLLLADFKENHILLRFLESAQKNPRRKKRDRILIRKKRNSNQHKRRKLHASLLAERNWKKCGMTAERKILGIHGRGQ